MLLFFMFVACGGPAASSKEFDKDIAKEVVTVTSKKTSFLSSQAVEEVSCTETEEFSHLNETEKAKHKLNRARKKTDCMIEYLRIKDLGQATKSFEEYCK